MTKRQSETEPATKTVAEVAPRGGGVRQWCASNGSIAGRGIAPGPSCYPVGAPEIAGYERSLPDLMAGNARRYGRSDKLALCRDVMYEKSL